MTSKERERSQPRKGFRSIHKSTQITSSHRLKTYEDDNERIDNFKAVLQKKLLPINRSFKYKNIPTMIASGSSKEMERKFHSTSLG